jgi:UrcA family protein
MRLSRTGVKQNLSVVKNLAIHAFLQLAFLGLVREVDRNNKGDPMLSCCRYVQIVGLALVAALMASPIEPVNAAILRARTTSVTVRFRSGDLDTPQGVAGLYRRIRAAAESVCGQFDDALLPEKLLWNQCVDQAIAGAVARVHSEGLSAYRGHQIRGRRRLLLETAESLAVREPAAP